MNSFFFESTFEVKRAFKLSILQKMRKLSIKHTQTQIHIYTHTQLEWTTIMLAGKNSCNTKNN